MNKTLKIFSIILMVAMLSCTMFSTVYAAGAPEFNPGVLTGTTTTNQDLTDYANKIIGTISTIGIVLSVVVLSFIGIKFMLGSAEEKAEYKKTLMPYVFGAALVFGASTIANIIYSFVK